MGAYTPKGSSSGVSSFNGRTGDVVLLPEDLPAAGVDSLFGSTGEITELNHITVTTTPVGVPATVATISYDPIDKTLQTLLPDGVTLQHGQEEHTVVKNVTGGTLLNGKVVYISGTDSGRATVAYAKADAAATSATTVGLLTHDILDGAEGKLTRGGSVHILDTSALSPGAVYVSPTAAGELTSIRPLYPYLAIRVGFVVEVSVTIGEILVDVAIFPDASQILLPANGIPSDVINVIDFFHHSWSTGLTDGGDLTDNGNGTVSIAASDFVVRIGTSEEDDLVIYRIPSSPPITYGSNDVTYIFLDYNNGTPIWGTGTSISSFNGIDKVIVYIVSHNPAIPLLSIIDLRKINIDAGRKVRRKSVEWNGYIDAGFWQSSIAASEVTGSGLNLIVGAGKYFYFENAITHTAFNTVTAGTALPNVFTQFYNRTGNWSQLINQKTVNNLQYDLNGTLTTMTNGRFRADWLYVVLDGVFPYLALITGDTQYTSLALAQDSAPPGVRPPQITGSSVLLAQIVIGKSDASPTIRQAGSVSFGSSAVSALPATAITVTPVGTIASTDVQAALAELDTEKQTKAANLTALAGLVSAEDKLPHFTGAGAAALTTLTYQARQLLAAINAADQRTILGLGTLATQGGTFSGISSGTNTGDQDLTTLLAKTGIDSDVNGAYTSSLSYNESTRTISLAPTSLNYNVFVQGIKYTKTTQTLSHSATAGGYFFYFNNVGTLVVSTTPWNLLKDAPVAYVFWDGTKGIPFDERHHSGRDIWWHRNQHATEGTKQTGGFLLAGYTVTSGGATDAQNTWSIPTGRLEDEDIIIDTQAIPDNGPYTGLYRDAGGAWLISRSNTVPFFHTANTLQYNQLGVGLTVLAEDQFVNYYLFGLTALPSTAVSPPPPNTEQVVFIPGQAVFATQLLATTESVTSLTWGTFPFQEICPLWKITLKFNAAGAGSNTSTGRCNIVDVVKLTGSGATLQSSNQIDHGSLLGLTDQDHPATAIFFTPTGNLVATDVQAAIVELDTEKQAASANLTTLASATAAGLALMDDVDAAAQRATLGLGSIATESDTAFARMQWHMNVVALGVTHTVPVDHQQISHRSYTVLGTLNLDGELIVL